MCVGGPGSYFLGVGGNLTRKEFDHAEFDQVLVLSKEAAENLFVTYPEQQETPHPTPCTLNPKPYTLHPKTYTLHPTPYTLYHTPYAGHPTPYTLHPTLYTLRPTLYTLHPTPYALRALCKPHPIP